MATIGFIGLGNMGGPMAINLVEAGHQVQAFDLSEEAVKRVADAGATAASSAKDAVKGAEFVVSMLPAGKHVRGLFLGDDGLLQAMEQGALLIDSSTIDADSARAVAEAAKAAGCAMIDAPVSGGVAGAEGGTLTFMVGGGSADVDRARPLLEVMGAKIFHAGDAGAGQVAKMCNNMLLAISMVGTSEALNLGVSEGLDPSVLSDIMQSASGGNWVLNVYNPYPGVMEKAPASRGYTGGFGTALMLKDLGLAADAAVKCGASTPLGGLARQLYAMHAASGSADKDFSSILQMLQGRAQ